MHERYKSIISTPTWPLLFQSSSFFTFLLQKLISLVESLHEPAALAMFITMMYTLYGYGYLHVISVERGMDGSGKLWSLTPHWCVIRIGKFVLQSGARLHTHRLEALILTKLQVRLSSMEGQTDFLIFRPMPCGKSSFDFHFRSINHELLKIEYNRSKWHPWHQWWVFSCIFLIFLTKYWICSQL